MIDGLKPYPAYKDTDLPWLEKVPAHWDLYPNRALMRRRKVLVRDRQTEYRLLSLTKEGVIVRNVESGKGKFSADMDTFQEVRNGDLVFCLFDIPETPRTVGLSHFDGMITGAYTVFECSDPVLATFLDLFYRALDDRKLLSPLYSGLRNTIPPTRFLSTKTPVPPPDEQAVIVRFLDHANRRIDRYIRAKRRLIALLNEQKQAIIHQAVTRGLDPNVRLKPSDIELLGDIPEHWDEVFLGRCLRRIDQGWSPVAAEGEISPEQWAVLTLSSVKRGVFNATAIKPVPVSAKILNGIEIEDGDLLLTRSNTRELVGDVCLVQGARPKTVICDLIYRVIPKPTLFDRSFLMFQLLSPVGRRQIERDARGSSGTMPKINQRHIRSWRVLAPPLEEQLRIVKAIEAATQYINEVVMQTQTEISLLTEYRTRLVADVVTGQLDVRAAAANLQDAPEEPALLVDEGDAIDAEQLDADLVGEAEQ